MIDCGLCGSDVIEAFNFLQNVSFTDFEASTAKPKMRSSELFREGTGQLKGHPVRLHPRMDKAKALAELIHMVEPDEIGSLFEKQLAHLASAVEALGELEREVLQVWPKDNHDVCLKLFWSLRNESSVEKRHPMWEESHNPKISKGSCAM